MQDFCLSRSYRNLIPELCFIGDTGKQAVTKKHVLVMDEVDGMAGNEDRGKYVSSTEI